MPQKTQDILFSKAVRETQEKLGSDQLIQKLSDKNYWKSELSEEQVQFVQDRNSFYLGTSSAEGRPYIQHRGGSKGFIQIKNTSTLWFPDYSGNRQYISIGNLSENNQAFIFFMDYAHRRRLKLWGNASLLPKDTYPLKVAQQVKHGGIEHIIQFNIEAVDENCRQHITQYYTNEEYALELQTARKEIANLKNTLQKLEQTLYDDRKK